jgi:hypothetical protein
MKTQQYLGNIWENDGKMMSNFGIYSGSSGIYEKFEFVRRKLGCIWQSKWSLSSKKLWFDHQIVLNQWLMSMDWFKGKFTGNHRFSMIFPLNMGLSCKFSLNPIHWYYWIQPSNVAVLMTQDWLGSLMVEGLRQSYESYRVTPGYRYICLAVCLSICLFVCLPVWLPACCLFVCRSITRSNILILSKSNLK